MKKTYSQTRKATHARDLRSRRSSERRFNTALKEFLKHKYSGIYSEYTELFNLMNAEHPNRRDLATSTTFQKWKAANPDTTFSLIPQMLSADIINTALHETFAEDINTTEQQFEGTPGENIDHLPPFAEDINTTEQQFEGTPGENIDHLPPFAEDINTTEQQFEGTPGENIDHLPPFAQDINTTEQQFEETPGENIDHHLPPPPEPQLDNVAGDILNEIMENEAMRNLLEQPDPNEDEGIELNVFDEIDIEPFDFNVDVEPYDF